MLTINNVESLNVPFVYKTDSMYFEAKLQYSKTVSDLYEFNLWVQDKHKYVIYLCRDIRNFDGYTLSFEDQIYVDFFDTVIPFNELLNRNWFANFIIDYVNNQ